MKNLLFSALMFGALSFITSCNDDEITIPSFSVEIEGFANNDTITVPQGDTVKFNLAVENISDYQVKWTTNNNVVSTEPTFIFTPEELGNVVVEATVTSFDGGVSNATVLVNVEGKYKHGTFVLNEGNMSDGTGSLIFISPKGIVTDSAYYKVNNTLLGNASQDLFIANNKMYIISQNGAQNGGEGRLIIANAETLKKENVFNKELETLSWPTHLAILNEKIYIRDNKGIYTFNPTDKTLEFVKGTQGAIKNRMAVVTEKVFAAQRNNLLVLQEGNLIHTIKMPGNISGVIKADKNNLWVSCTSKPAVICKVNAESMEITQTNELGNTQVGAGFAAAPGISAKGDTIYFSNNTTQIKRHIFNEKKTEDVADVKKYVENASMVYSNLAVNPVTGEVLVPTIKGFGLDYLINSIAIFDFSNQTSPLKANYKNYTKFPAGIYFTENF